MIIRPYGQQINIELCRVHPHDCFAVIGSKTMYGVLYIVCLLRLPWPDQLSVHTDAQLCQLIVRLTRLQGLLEYIIYIKVQQPPLLVAMRILLYDILLTILLM